MGSERRRPAERADTVSVKHKGDSWKWGQRGERARNRKTPRLLFVCRIVCLLVPFLCHLTLPSSPLLVVSDLSLLFSLLWPCPLLALCSLPFVWQAFCLEIIPPPSSLRLAPWSLLGLLLLLQTYLLLFPFISPPHSLAPLLSKWLLWKQVYLEMAGDVALCLSFLMLLVHEKVRAPVRVCTLIVYKCVCLCMHCVCVCVPPSLLWGSTHSYMHFTSEGFYLYQTSVTEIVTMDTTSEDH